MEGFPAGWNVAIGDNVAVAPSLATTGLSAQPVSHWVTMSAAPGDLRPDTPVGGTGGPVMVAATMLEPSLSAKRQRGSRTLTPVMAAVADRASSAGADRILAMREA